MTSSGQGSVPEPPHAIPEQRQRSEVRRYAVVSDVSLDHRAQPGSHLGDRTMHAAPEFGLHLRQLGLQSPPHRLPQYREPSDPILPADMREAEEVEGLRPALAALASSFCRVAAELQQAGFVGMQLQSELAHTFGQIVPEPLGIRSMLKAQNEVVRVAHRNHVAMRLRPPPPLGPEVE